MIAILLGAAAVRLSALNWDAGIAAHPDERHIVGVAERLTWPGGLDPFDADPSFPYGHLPLYLLALARGIVPRADSILIARTLSALIDLVTVALAFLLGRRVFGEAVGILAAAFLAVMVQHVQQAHYYIVDVPLACFALGALFFAVRLAGRGRLLDASLAGGCAGLAVGTKSSGLLLVLPLAAAVVLAPAGARARWLKALACIGAAVAAFTLTNPCALAGPPMFWRNAAQQAAIVRGVLDVPYTRQFHGTWPYVYPLFQLMTWGMGWLPGLAALAGLGSSVWRAVRQRPDSTEWVLLAWAVPFLAFFGAIYAKFPRYLLPVTPLLAIYAARFLVSEVSNRLRDRPVMAHAVVLVPLAAATLRCVALLGMFRSPHPWVVATEWFAQQVPAGAVVAIEEWDHPLPLDASPYAMRTLAVFAEDTPAKWEAMVELLAQADYVIIASQRGYGALARWPSRYPVTARYYRLLFDGKLGFEAAACFSRQARLGPLALVDDPTAGLEFALPAVCWSEATMVVRLGRLDESFVVYDHAQTVVFRRTEPALSSDELLVLITGGE